jgi:Tol biopolymer transport system component
MTDAVGRLTSALADRYAIERELGAGGMATVYLAQDVRHDRKVALKVVRPELAAILGGERFLAEIKTTANLQHPHILGLFDSGEADGLVFYVMPYVEGESLRDRLTREKQLPVDDALRITREVASALDYAHRHGVVHRDIKPENILLHDGSALVADFGIALAVSRSEGGTRMTETGMSLGTPHYMSPEQAMGEREITPKSDIYALGCVLYEMLTGEPPFTGPTAQAVVARVMTEEPRRLTLQRKTIPPHVEAAVDTALAKLPADRFATAAQFAEALGNPGFGASPIASPARGHAGTRARRTALLAAGAVVLLALGAVLGGSLGGRGAPAAVTRLNVVLPAGQRMNASPFPVLAVAPDGSAIAYVVDEAATTRTYIRRLDDPVPRLVEGSDGSIGPGFSPDGRWLYFSTSTALLRVPVAGGTPTSVPVPAGALAGVASVDPALITTGNGHIAALRPDGSLDTLAAPEPGSGRILMVQDRLPNGRILAILGYAGPLVSIEPRSTRQDTLVNALVTGAQSDRGYLAWVEQSGVAFGARLHRSGRRIEGQPVQLDAGVRLTPGGTPTSAWSRNGVMVFVGFQPSDLVHVDRAGSARPLTTRRFRYHSPRVSPDGRMIATDITEASTRNVWLLDRRDSTLTRFSFEHWGHDPMWARDGRTIVFAADVGGSPGIFTRAADGSGAAESVLVVTDQLTAHSVGAPGSVLAVRIGGGGQDIVSVPLTGERRETTPLLASPYLEAYPALSPDGRWLAYTSDESGRNEVYVRSFPGPGRRAIVSQNGGTEPVWAPNGRELFYRAPAGEPMLVAATLDLRGEARVTERRSLFAIGDYEGAAPHANYDVFPDGSGFVMIRVGRASELTVIQNWPEIVRRQAAAGSR